MHPKSIENPSKFTPQNFSGYFFLPNTNKIFVSMHQAGNWVQMEYECRNAIQSSTMPLITELLSK